MWASVRQQRPPGKSGCPGKKGAVSLRAARGDGWRGACLLLQSQCLRQRSQMYHITLNIGSARPAIRWRGLLRASWPPAGVCPVSATWRSYGAKHSGAGPSRWWEQGKHFSLSALLRIKQTKACSFKGSETDSCWLVCFSYNYPWDSARLKSVVLSGPLCHLPLTFNQFSLCEPTRGVLSVLIDVVC